MAPAAHPDYKPGHVLEAATGGYLVKSKTTPGAWWLVFGDTCSCPHCADRESCVHRRQRDAFCRALDADRKRPVAPAAPPSMFVD